MRLLTIGLGCVFWLVGGVSLLLLSSLFWGITRMATLPGNFHCAGMVYTLSQPLHTSSGRGLDRCEVIAILSKPSLPLSSLAVCRNGAKLVLQIIGSTSTINSRHHIKLSPDDASAAKCYKQYLYTVRWGHPMANNRRAGGFAHTN